MGVSGYGALVDRCIRHVRFMVEALKKTGEFEEVLMPMTNILLYRYVPVSMRLKTKSAADPLTAVMSAEQNAAIDKVNVEMQNMQKLRGSTFVSRTTIFSPKQQCRVVALRVVIANPLTTEVDILTTLKDQLEIVKKIDGFY
jgi:glutamate/tyrosine decarboxylase-like PLP-dependent enzyme